MAEFDDTLELPRFRKVEAAIVRELVELLKVHVLLVDDDHAACGLRASVANETFQIRNKVVEAEKVRCSAVNNVVLFAVGVLQKAFLVDAYEVGPVLQDEIEQR